MNSMTFKKDLIGVQNDLLRFAYKLTSDREEANDLLQETSLKASVSYTHLRAHETGRNLVCRLLLEKKKKKKQK